MSFPDDQHNGRATLREVIAMVDALEAKIDARLEAVRIKFETEREAHASDHRREEDRTAGRLRWAVTTLMTGAGVLFTIIWALVHTS